MQFRGDLHLVIEQPSGSWAFKQAYTVSMIATLQLFLDLFRLEFFQNTMFLSSILISGCPWDILLDLFGWQFIRATLYLRFCVLTYMGMYSHDMEKCTHLRCSLRPSTVQPGFNMCTIVYNCSFLQLVSCFQGAWLNFCSPARSMQALGRKCTKADKLRIKTRFAKRQAKRKVQKAHVAHHVFKMFEFFLRPRFRYS